MFGYLWANVVKSHKLNHIVANHCLAIDFILKLEPSGSDVFRDEFGGDLGITEGYLDTEALCGGIWESGRLW